MFRPIRGNSRFSSTSSAYSSTSRSSYPDHSSTNIIQVETDGTIKQSLLKPTTRPIGHVVYPSNASFSQEDPPQYKNKPDRTNLAYLDDEISNSHIQTESLEYLDKEPFDDYYQENRKKELQKDLQKDPVKESLEQKDHSGSIRKAIEEYLLELLKSPWLKDLDLSSRFIKAINNEPYSSVELEPELDIPKKEPLDSPETTYDYGLYFSVDAGKSSTDRPLDPPLDESTEPKESKEGTDPEVDSELESKEPGPEPKESKVSEVDSELESKEAEPSLEPEPELESPNSLVEDPLVNTKTYIPFFNNELYCTNDSKTELSLTGAGELKLEAFVELVGLIPMEARLYLFGREKYYQVGEFKEQLLTFNLKNDTQSGTSTGYLTIEEDLYVVRFMTFTLNHPIQTDEMITIDSFDLPLEFLLESQILV